MTFSSPARNDWKESPEINPSQIKNWVTNRQAWQRLNEWMRSTEVAPDPALQQIDINLNTIHRSSDGKDHSDVVLNNTHRVSDGSDHTFIDQAVLIASSPTFAGLTTTAGRIQNTTRKTTTYTIVANDENVFCDTDGGAFTATLPAGVDGTHYKVMNCGTSAELLTVAPDGSELLIGENSNFTLNDGEALDLVYETTEGWN